MNKIKIDFRELCSDELSVWWIDEDRDYALIKKRPDLMMSVLSHKIVNFKTGGVLPVENLGGTDYVNIEGKRIPVFNIFAECFIHKLYVSSYIRAKDKCSWNVNVHNLVWARYMIHDYEFMRTLFEGVALAPMPTFRIVGEEEDFQCTAWHIGSMLGVSDAIVTCEMETLIPEFQEGEDWWVGELISLDKGRVVSVGKTVVYGFKMLQRYVQYNSMVDYRNTSLIVLLTR